MQSKASAIEKAGGKLKVTVKDAEKSTAFDKALGFLMPAIGFLGALAVGYMVLPALLYEKVEQPFQFNHAIHMGEKAKMNCEDCHGFRDDGTFVGIPPTSSCADCHAEPIGDGALEKQLVDEYIKPGKEIPWLVYSRQPDNAFFPHVAHVKKAKIPCSHCHGNHGETDSLRPHERNALTGYSRDIWGKNIAGINTNSWEEMKMDDCADCHTEKGVKDSCMMCHK